MFCLDSLALPRQPVTVGCFSDLSQCLYKAKTIYDLKCGRAGLLVEDSGRVRVMIS